MNTESCVLLNRQDSAPAAVHYSGMCGAILDVTVPVFSIFGKFSEVCVVLENYLLSLS